MAGNTYRIGEAADLLQLKSYVLRFWETEFTQLAPLRTDKGQRLYTEAHLELLRRIRHLLHEQGMTIDGARRVLLAEQRQGAEAVKSALGQSHLGSHSGSLPGSHSGSLPAAGYADLGAPRVSGNVEPFVPASPFSAASAGAGPEAMRLVRDELLELRNLLLSH